MSPIQHERPGQMGLVVTVVVHDEDNEEVEVVGPRHGGGEGKASADTPLQGWAAGLGAPQKRIAM